MASSDDTNECFDDTTMEMLSANLPISAFTVHAPDPRLERARQEMERTNKITPVLKEELRLRILNKRLQKGEPEIEINPGEPQSYELTEEEKAKRERRNAQNRRAAKKCREKRKMKLQTDAEKYRHIREENQQLRNGVTYLLHKEDVYRKFCLEHILNSQCPAGVDDEAGRRRLLALLGSDMLLQAHGHHRPEATSSCSTARPAVGALSHGNQAASSSSTARPAVGALSHGSQAAPSTSTTTTHHSSYQCQGQTCFAPGSLQPCTSPHGAPRLQPCTLPRGPPPLQPCTSQSMFQSEQSVTVMGELREIPIHEISSLLPPESDFSVSDHDHSLECSPPARSPNSLFPADASYFAYLTPSTSYSSNNNTSSFSSSSDAMFAISPTGHNIMLSSSYLNSSVSSPALPSHDMSLDYLPRELIYDDHATKHIRDSDNHNDISSGLHLQTELRGQCIPSSQADHNHTSSLAPASITAVALPNNVFVNTAFLSELTHYPDRYLNSYVKAEQRQNMTDSFSSYSMEPQLHTVIISPLTPQSPPSPTATPSHSFNQRPLSPISLSADLAHSDSPTAHASYHNPVSPHPTTPAHRAVRRMSSSTSVASPFSSHHVSVGLSPPPSVPSPASNGVPESPPILGLPSGCTEMSYLPHLPSFCSSADSLSHVEHDFN